MENTYSATALIGLLKKQTAQLCLTAVIPFGQQDSEEVKKLKIDRVMTQAMQYLRQHSPEIYSSETALRDKSNEVHYDRQCSGIGIFTSKEIWTVFSFLFPVKEKFMLGDKFDLADLLFHAQYEQPGYILELTKKGASLFFNTLHDITEIKDDHFPLVYSDNYEYARPAHASSNKGSAVTQQFEHDKSHVQQIRYDHFVRQIDRYLSKYLFEAVPFIITGEVKLLNAFEKHSGLLAHLVGIFPGNFSKLPFVELHQLTSRFFKEHVDKLINLSIRSLVEKAGIDLAVEGITACWTAAMEGKGLLLLVEKDYRAVAFLSPSDNSHLRLTPPRNKHRILTNAVNELVYMVLEKKGKVLFIENGLLRDHQRIGLIKRYI